jgi:hypothetical protein
MAIVGHQDRHDVDGVGVNGIELMTRMVNGNLDDPIGSPSQSVKDRLLLV